MNGADETASLRRGIRIDLAIALCALLISALATAASLWQSHVVAEQFSSQVWPYLTFSTTYDPKYVSFQMDNDGLGPAIIRSTVLSIDGRSYANPVQAFGKVFKPDRSTYGAQIYGVSPGSVIRASASKRVFRIDARWAAPQFGAAATAGRFDFRVCYCSLLGNCWVVSAKQQNGDPQPVSACPAAGRDQYRVGASARF